MDHSTLAVLGGVAREVLTGARVRRVVGLDGGDVILSFGIIRMRDRAHPGAVAPAEFDNWLFSADARLFRVHPWEDPLPDRSVPSHLVDVLSHHLSSARVDDVLVTRFERIITLHFTRRDYTGEEVGYRFVAELMGKHSNLILIDSSGIILATFKPVHSYQSRVRELRAGKEYRPPPRQERVEPREFTPDEWHDFLGSAESGEHIDDLIARTFQGMSQVWAHAVCDRAGVFPEIPVVQIDKEAGEKLRTALLDTMRTILAGVPLTREAPEVFVRRVTADFIERAEDFAIDRARTELTRIINRRRKKLGSLEEGLAKDLDLAGDAAQYRKKADLLLANLFRISPGMEQLEVEDWETKETVVLPLDHHLTPQLQMERWYERYRKLKRTEQVARERRQAVHAENEELTRLEERLAAASSVDEINHVREECVLHGLISPVREDERGKGKRAGAKPAQVGAGLGRHGGISAHRYRSNDGFLILAGTNDFSNDALRKASSPDDTWLHVRDIPGAHVYIVARGREVPESTLKEAAMVAVWHSRARDGSNVPVDYTRVKYLAPIPGAGPGKVRFRRERTIRMTADPKRIEMMSLMAGGGEGNR